MWRNYPNGQIDFKNYNITEMSEYRELTTEKREYLTKVSLKIREVINEGVESIYLWNLDKEVNFISRVLTNGVYNLYYDSDRLNSLKNLVGYIDRKDYKS